MVVVAVALAVVEQRRVLARGVDGLARDGARALGRGLSGRRRHLQQVERRPRIAAREVDDRAQRALVDAHLLLAQPLVALDRARHDRPQRVRIERVQHEDAGA